MAMLMKGLSGEPVRRLQAKLGIEADGEFGPNTEKALKDWQTKNGLSADGVAGPDSLWVSMNWCCSNLGRAAMRSRSYRKS